MHSFLIFTDFIKGGGLIKCSTVYYLVMDFHRFFLFSVKIYFLAILRFFLFENTLSCVFWLGVREDLLILTLSFVYHNEDFVHFIL